MTLKLADTPKTTWNQFPSVPANNLSRPVERKIHRKKLKRFLLASGNSNFIQHLKGRFLTKAHAQRARRYTISFPEAAILLVSDGDRDLWPDGILSPQIADFRLHCAESKVKPKMAERSGPDTFLEGVKFGLEKVGKANITLKQKQEEILKIIALTQKDVLAVLPTGYGKSKKDWHSAP